MDLPDIGSMSSTHSANPLACVAGKENLFALINDGLISRAHNLGTTFHGALAELKTKYPDHLKYVFGKGLVAGLIFVDKQGAPLTDLCDKVCELAFRRGLLLIHTGREAIKLAPPLSITEEALLEGVSVLDDCIRDAL